MKGATQGPAAPATTTLDVFFSFRPLPRGEAQIQAVRGVVAVERGPAGELRLIPDPEMAAELLERLGD